MMPLYMGIDGGGSNVRVVITDADLHPRASAHGGTVNPSVVGRAGAKHAIQTTMREALQHVNAEQVRGVGIGIAGAPNYYAEEWLQEVVAEVLPQTQVVASSDNEIALVGATGKPEGILLLAGTGSVGFGRNAQGKAMQWGGWGYLVADEASGFWFGKQAILQVTRFLDGEGGNGQTLAEHVLKTIGMTSARELIEWLYTGQDPVVPKVAKLAPLVFELAQTGDAYCQSLVAEAGDYLLEMARSLQRQLHLFHAPIIFAGSLLTNPTPLSDYLVQGLGLAGIPQVQHSAVLGGALLAKLHTESPSA